MQLVVVLGTCVTIHLFIYLLGILSFYFQFMLIKYSLVEIFPFHYCISLVHTSNYATSSQQRGKHKQFDYPLYISPKPKTLQFSGKYLSFKYLELISPESLAINLLHLGQVSFLKVTLLHFAQICELQDAFPMYFIFLLTISLFLSSKDKALKSVVLKIVWVLEPSGAFIDK